MKEKKWFMFGCTGPIFVFGGDFRRFSDGLITLFQSNACYVGLFSGVHLPFF